MSNDTAPDLTPTSAGTGPFEKGIESGESHPAADTDGPFTNVLSLSVWGSLPDPTGVLVPLEQDAAILAACEESWAELSFCTTGDTDAIGFVISTLFNKSELERPAHTDAELTEADGDLFTCF